MVETREEDQKEALAYLKLVLALMMILGYNYSIRGDLLQFSLNRIEMTLSM